MRSYFCCGTYFQEPDIRRICQQRTERNQINQGKPACRRNCTQIGFLNISAHNCTKPEHHTGKKHLPRRTGKIIHFFLTGRTVFGIQCSQSPRYTAENKKQDTTLTLRMQPFCIELFRIEHYYSSEAYHTSRNCKRVTEINTPHGNVQQQNPKCRRGSDYCHETTCQILLCQHDDSHIYKQQYNAANGRTLHEAFLKYTFSPQIANPKKYQPGSRKPQCTEQERRKIF